MTKTVNINGLDGMDFTVLHEKWPVKRWNAQQKVLDVQ